MEGVRRISRGEGEKSDLIESLLRITQSRKLKPTIQISCEPKLNRAQARLSPGIQLWGRTGTTYIKRKRITSTSTITI